MAQSFNITAKLNIQAPTNLAQVRSDIASNLKNIPVNLSFQVPKALNSKLNQLNKSIPTFSNNLDIMSASAKTATAAINQLNSAFQKMQIQSNALTPATKQLNSVARSSAQAGKDIQNFGKQAGIALRRFAAFAVGASALVGTVQSLRTAIKEAADFQNELVRLSQVTSRPLVGLKGISDQVTELATNFGVSSNDILKAATTLAQAGFRAEELRASLDTLAKTTLAPTFDTIEKTTEGLIATFNQFSLKADEIASSFDAINAVSARYAVESGDIIEAVKRAGGAFVQTGGNLNEFLALFTAVRDTTRQSAETIATGFNTIFTRLQRPQTIKFLQEIGVEVVDLEGKFVGPYKAVQALNEALSSLKPGDIRFAQIAEQLGGYRQIPRLIPLIREFALAQEAYGVALSGQGSLNRDAIKSQDSLARQFQKVQEQFFAMVRSFGENQQIKQTLQILLDLSSASIKLVDSLKPLIPLIGIIGAIRGGAFISNIAKGIRSGRTFARGGLVPGSGDSDSVPAMLMPGEFVIRKKAVQEIGVDRLEGYNQGSYQRKASGGSAYLSGFSSGESKLLNNYLWAFTSKTGYKPNELAKSINKSNMPGYAGLFTPGPNIDFFSPGRIEIGNTKDLKGTLFHELAHGLDYKLGNQMPSAFTNQASLDFVNSFSAGLEKINIGKYINKPGYNYITQIEELFAEGVAQTLNPSKLYGTNLKLPTQTLFEMSKIAKSGIFRRRAYGGSVGSVPTLLTPGEFVINKDAAQSIGLNGLYKLNNADKVQQFNNGGLVRFANGGLSRGTPYQRGLVRTFSRGTRQKAKNFATGTKKILSGYGTPTAAFALQATAGQPYEPIIGETQESFQRNSATSNFATSVSAGLIAGSVTPGPLPVKLAVGALTAFATGLTTSANQLKEFKINQLNQEVNNFTDTLQRYSSNLGEVLDNPQATPEEIRKAIAENKNVGGFDLKSIFARARETSSEATTIESVGRFFDKNITNSFGIESFFGPTDAELRKRGSDAATALSADAATSLSEQANKLLRAEIKAGGTVNTPEQIKAVLGGVFDQLITATTESDKISRAEAEKKQIERLTRNTRPEAGLAELEKLAIAANKSASRLQEFATTVVDFGNNVEAMNIKFSGDLNELESRLSGGFARDTSLDGLSLFGRTGQLLGEQFGKSLENAVNKGLITPELAGFGRDVSQTTQNLPAILKTFLSTSKIEDIQNTEVVKGLVDQLQLTTPQLAESLKTSLSQTIGSLNASPGSRGTSELEKAIRNPESVIEEVLDTSTGAISGAFNAVLEQSRQLQERQIKIEEKRLQVEQEIVSQLTQSSDLSFERDRLAASFGGRLEFTAGDNRQRDLFNNLGVSGSVDEISQRIQELNATRREGLSPQEQSGIISETTRLTQALQSLTNVSELTKVSFEKLQRANEKQQAKGQIARSIFKGGEVLQNTLRDASIIAQVKSVGSLNGASGQFITQFLEALEGPIGKLLPPEFLRQVAENTGGAQGDLLRTIASVSDEEKKIQQEIIKVYNQGIQASNALADITAQNMGSIDSLNATLSDSFNTQLLTSQKDLTTAMQNLTVVFREAYPEGKSAGGPVYAAKGFTPRGTDTVPALMGNKPFMLTPGEFVINARSSRKYRPILEALNNDTMYAADGFDLSGFDKKQQKIINNVLNRISSVLTIKDDANNIIKPFNINDFVNNITSSDKLNNPQGILKRPALGLSSFLRKAKKSNIYINPGISNNDLSYVLSHEIGHSIYRKLGLPNSSKLITEILPNLEKQRTSLIDKNLIRANKPNLMVQLANLDSEKFYSEAFADNFSASIFADTDTKSFQNKYGGSARPTSLSKLQRSSLASIPQLIKQTILTGNSNPSKKSQTVKLTPNQIAEIEESEKIKKQLTSTPKNISKKTLESNFDIGDTKGARNQGGSAKDLIARARAAKKIGTPTQVQKAIENLTRIPTQQRAPSDDIRLNKLIQDRINDAPPGSLVGTNDLRSPTRGLGFGPNPGQYDVLPSIPQGGAVDLSAIKPVNNLSQINPIEEQIKQVKESTRYKLRRPDRNRGPAKQLIYGQNIKPLGQEPFSLSNVQNFDTSTPNIKPGPAYALENSLPILGNQSDPRLPIIPGEGRKSFLPIQEYDNIINQQKIKILLNDRILAEQANNSFKNIVNEIDGSATPFPNRTTDPRLPIVNQRSLQNIIKNSNSRKGIVPFKPNNTSLGSNADVSNIKSPNVLTSDKYKPDSRYKTKKVKPYPQFRPSISSRAFSALGNATQSTGNAFNSVGRAIGQNKAVKSVGRTFGNALPVVGATLDIFDTAVQANTIRENGLTTERGANLAASATNTGLGIAALFGVAGAGFGAPAYLAGLGGQYVLNRTADEIDRRGQEKYGQSILKDGANLSEETQLLLSGNKDALKEFDTRTGRKNQGVLSGMGSRILGVGAAKLQGRKSSKEKSQSIANNIKNGRELFNQELGSIRNAPRNPTLGGYSSSYSFESNEQVEARIKEERRIAEENKAKLKAANESSFTNDPRAIFNGKQYEIEYGRTSNSLPRKSDFRVETRLSGKRRENLEERRAERAARVEAQEKSRGANNTRADVKEQVQKDIAAPVPGGPDLAQMDGLVNKIDSLMKNLDKLNGIEMTVKVQDIKVDLTGADAINKMTDAMKNVVGNAIVEHINTSLKLTSDKIPPMAQGNV